ncbi:MAG: HD-GYP domain-containing protein [Candidatus Latescibacteria bacterium]|nr:HD-GYP domain-containing protein [Candidatus Latescibacterota bacterium]
MRLIDILREKKSRKTAVGTLSKSTEFSLQYMPGEAESKVINHSGGHLQAGDLAALYDLDKKTGEPNPESTAGQAQAPSAPAASAGVDEREVETGKDGTSGPSAAQIVHSREGGGGPDVMAEKPQQGYLRAGDSMTMETELYQNMEDVELADALHIELLTLLDDLYEEGKMGEDIYVERLITPLTRTIDLSHTSNALLRKAVRLKRGGRSFTSHSLNVAILAIKIGIARGYSDERVFSLALCALLGDIGMAVVDPAILNKAGKLTPEEFAEIKRHVEYSVQVVKSISGKFPFLAPIIYQIHERENGSGYPQALRGANIHEFAKIIGMCDVYIALTEPKANRENYSGYVAMQQIISRRGIDFNAKIIKTLIDVISVFPLESLVRLNNGAIGRVIDISAIHPTRPKLSILINSDGEKLHKPMLLDLEKEPLLYIENPDIEEGVIL